MTAAGSTLPPQHDSLAALHAAACVCRRCPLGEEGSRAVASMGPAHAPLMLVLEGPAHEDDITGQALSGPAGRMLAEAMVRAELAAKDVYITFAVRHFGWRAHGARRQARRPTPRELAACHPFLTQEVALVAPRLLVALGHSAVRSVVGRTLQIDDARGHVFDTSLAPALVSHHPAAIARLRAGARARKLAELTYDLSVAQRLAAQLGALPATTRTPAEYDA